MCGSVSHGSVVPCFLFSGSSRQWLVCGVSLCFIHALPLHLPISIASESLPFFGTRRVSWSTSNYPSHVTVVLCCVFLGRGSISSDRERLLRFARLPHAGGVCWRDLHRMPKHSPWPAWRSLLCLRRRGPSSFPRLTAVWNVSLGKACLLPPPPPQLRRG